MKKLRNPDRDEHIKKAIRNARWQPIAARYPKVKSIYRDPQGKGSIAQLVHRVQKNHLTSIDIEAREMQKGLAGTANKKYITSMDAEKQSLAKLTKETQTK